MEYLTGVRHKDTLEISELRKQAQPGQTVKVNGAVHAIRNMGTVAFVILRKREGLLQGVYEEGAFALTISMHTRPAPCSLQRIRYGMSVTPAIGARITLFSSSTFPIFNVIESKLPLRLRTVRPAHKRWLTCLRLVSGSNTSCPES